MSIQDSLKMIDYYCNHKNTKDTIVIFYHTVKKLVEHDSSNAFYEIHQKFHTYFSKKDISKLDHEHKQVLKATTLIMQKNKEKIYFAPKQSNKQLSQQLITPLNSINLQIDSNRHKSSINDKKQSDIFKTSWNQNYNQMNGKQIRYQKTQSVISQFGQSYSVKNNYLEDLQNYYNQLMQEYNNHQLDKANKTACKLEILLKNSEIKTNNDTKWMSQINNVQKQYMQMINYYKEFDQPGWEFDNTNNGISLYSKTINKGQHVAVLITAQLDISLLNFLVMAQQVDLFCKYVPFCGKGQMLKRVDRNLYIARSTVDIPLLTNRETYFYAKMIDRINTTNSLFCYSKSINNNIQACKKYEITIPQKSSYVRLQYNFFIVQFKIKGKDKIDVRMATSVDMKLNFLPNFILMISARKFAYQYFMNILKEQKKFQTSQWAKRLRQNRNVYGYYQSIIDKHLKSY